MMFPNGSFDGYNETANFDNSSDRSSHYFQPFGETYRTVATVVYTVIFLLGITGNSIVIFTIYASRSLHTSAYAYLVITVTVEVTVPPIAALTVINTRVIHGIIISSEVY